MYTWELTIKDFVNFLRLERALSDNSINAYINDVRKLYEYFKLKGLSLKPNQVAYHHLKDFIHWLNELGLSTSSQARLISGIKSFFKFLHVEEHIEEDPTELLAAPKLGRKLPVVLAVDEINQLINAVDLSQPEGHRNKAIVEVLYSCGLRVSELINLKMSNMYLNKGFIRVTGKGDKERLIPISQQAIKDIQNYYPYRNQLKIDPSSEDILFLTEEEISSPVL